jgi:hypothetical protein
LGNPGGITGQVRLDVRLTDAGGLASVSPSHVHLACGLTVNSGTPGSVDPLPLTGIDLQHALVGSCPSAAGFALASGDSDSFHFTILFDSAVPTGALHLNFTLVQLDGGGAA